VTDRDPAAWPDGVEQIGLEDLGRLGINRHDQLFWDGRRIEVRQSIALTGFQKVIATLAALCAVLGALGGFVTGFNNASIFLCARGIGWLSCPLTPPGPPPASPPR
jgi:hypothetical protein